jgi:hypothetical protein
MLTRVAELLDNDTAVRRVICNGGGAGERNASFPSVCPVPARQQSLWCQLPYRLRPVVPLPLLAVSVGRKVKALCCILGRLVDAADECEYIDPECDPARVCEHIELYLAGWDERVAPPRSSRSTAAANADAWQWCRLPAEFLAAWFVYYYVVRRTGAIIAAHGDSPTATAAPPNQTLFPVATKLTSVPLARREGAARLELDKKRIARGWSVVDYVGTGRLYAVIANGHVPPHELPLESFAAFVEMMRAAVHLNLSLS